MQILIAEDDYASRKSMNSMLWYLGYEVIEACNGIQAWEYMQKQNPPLLLVLDIMMPQMDGLEVCRKIRAAGMRNQPYVIFVTARKGKEEVVQGLEAGANDYIVKPFEFGELSARINVGHRMIEVQSTLLNEIEERKKAQDNLQEAYNKLDNLVELNADGIMVIDLQGEILFTNPRAAQMLGQSETELLNKQFGFPLSLEKNTEIELLSENGSTTVVELRSQETKWNGRIALLTSFRDITERKLAEQELWEIKEEREAIYENAPLIMMLVDRNQKIREANSLTCEFFELSAQELIGRQVGKAMGCLYYFDGYPGCGWSQQCEECAFRNTVLSTFESGKNHNQVEVSSFLRQHGRERKVTLLVSTTLIPHSKESLVLLTIIDITERKQTEQELIKMEQQSNAALKEIQELVSSISSVLISVDYSCKIERWNNAAEKFLGISMQEAKGIFLYKCPVSWEWDRIESALEQSKQTHQEVRVEDLSYLSSNQVEGFLDIIIHPVFKEDRNVLTGFLILGSDITEKKLMESQFLQEQKMDAIGQLAAGIAHEINTPIQYVDGNTNYLKEVFQDVLQLFDSYSELLELTKQEQVHPSLVSKIAQKQEEIDIEFLREDIPNSLQESLEGLQKVAKIVGSMKNFAHPGENNFTYIDINKALDDTITICKNEWKYFTEVVTDYDPKLPYVSCLKDEINQVFLNIIVNSAQAIGEHGSSDGNGMGTITVSTSRNSEQAEIRISDTGPGIPDHLRERIFNPFFTTKQVGKGTGRDCISPTTS